MVKTEPPSRWLHCPCHQCLVDGLEHVGSSKRVDKYVLPYHNVFHISNHTPFCGVLHPHCIAALNSLVYSAWEVG
jgi:hypothetical protein